MRLYRAVSCACGDWKGGGGVRHFAREAHSWLSNFPCAVVRDGTYVGYEYECSPADSA
jgi:hypothetical protein